MLRVSIAVMAALLEILPSMQAPAAAPQKPPTPAAVRTPTISGACTLLVAAQAAHPIEEYAGRLYDVFPPARIASSLVSDNRASDSSC